MAFTYDPSTDAGLVRLLIHDTDDLVAANQLFTDAEITAFLTLEGNVVRRAAAAALESLAANQAMVLKVITMLDLSLDGAKLAAELRAQAKALRAQAEADVAASGGFDVAEMVVDQFTARERTWKEMLRGNL
jgi:hypothetical protein